MISHFKEDFRNKYREIKEIGKDYYFTVYLAENKQNKELRAIKKINLVKIRDLEDPMNGIRNMIICGKNNENSVKYYESFETENELAIVMEYYDENLGDLLKYKRFNSSEIYEILKQLNNAFKIMKENKIIHRDIKPENILIKYKNKEKNEFIVKLSDYILSTNKNEGLCLHCGTPIYIAPEIMKGKEYNYKCDLWSLGITIYILFFGEVPDRSMIKQMKKSEKQLIKKTEDKKLDDLIDKLLEENPDKRITWDEYFNHPFFNITQSK